MSNVIRFVWSGLRQEFLGESEEEQIENLKIAWALAGAATFCALDEQYEDVVKIDRFGGMVHNRKFLAILDAMSALSGDELADFITFLRYVLKVGASQAPSAS
jgi:hypothetical protein